MDLHMQRWRIGPTWVRERGSMRRLRDGRQGLGFGTIGARSGASEGGGGGV